MDPDRSRREERMCPLTNSRAATPTALNGLAGRRREAGRAEAEAAGAAIRNADGDAQRSTIVP